MPNHHQEPGQAVLSDAKLLTQLQAGDDASFDALFLRHYERIYNILYRLLGNQADAEDVAQQVFIKLYHSPRQVRLADSEANVAGWLYRVAVNMGYNMLRSRKRARTREEKQGWLWPLTASPDPAEAAESSDTQSEVRQVLAELKPREAKLLILRHSGLSYREVAAAMNLSPSSVGSLLTRAERAFAKRYRLMYPDKD